MRKADTAIRIWFTDCTREFTADTLPEHTLYRQLSEHISIEPDPEDPQIVFYSSYGQRFRKYNCLRIFFTLENDRPDPLLQDFSLSFDPDTPYRNVRLPFAWRLNLDESPLISRPSAPPKSRFCNFIYSNPNCAERNTFFHLLSAYKSVDSAGALFNNTPFDGPRNHDDPREAKVLFQQAYKFTIAFENQSVRGYTTEKLLHALLARTVPIYWGNPEVARDFDPNSFINCHDFSNFEAVVQYIKKVDQDDALFRRYLNARAWPRQMPSPKVCRDRALTKVAAFMKLPPKRRAYRSFLSRILAQVPEAYARKIIKYRQRSISRRQNLACRY